LSYDGTLAPLHALATPVSVYGTLYCRR